MTCNVVRGTKWKSRDGGDEWEVTVRPDRPVILSRVSQSVVPAIPWRSKRGRVSVSSPLKAPRFSPCRVPASGNRNRVLGSKRRTEIDDESRIVILVTRAIDSGTSIAVEIKSDSKADRVRFRSEFFDRSIDFLVRSLPADPRTNGSRISARRRFEFPAGENAECREFFLRDFV